MTQEIIEMAKQAGLFTHKEVQPEIVAFAKLVAEKALAQPHETTLKEFNQFIHDDPNYHIWAKKREAKVEGSLHVVCHCDNCKAQLEQEPVAWGVFEGNLHDMFFTQEEAQEMARLKGSHADVRPLYTHPPQRTEEKNT